MAAEKNFENRVKQYLDDYGCWWLKYWAGAAFTKTGIPDILVSSDGWFMALEVKAPNGAPSQLQLYHLRRIRDSGGYGVLLYPKDFEQFRLFNEHKSKTNAWYLENIKEQERWKKRLEEKER